MTTRRMSARLALAAAATETLGAPSGATPATTTRAVRARKAPGTTVPATATTSAPSRKRTRSAVDDDDNDQGAQAPAQDDGVKPAAAKRARTKATPAAAAAAAGTIGSTRASRLRAASTAATTAAKSAAAVKEKEKAAAVQTKKPVTAPKRKAATAADSNKKAPTAKAKGKAKATAAKVEEEQAQAPSSGADESDLSDLEEAGDGQPEAEQGAEEQDDRQRTIRFAPEPIVFDTSKDRSDRPPPRRVASKPPPAPQAPAAEPQAAEDAMDVDAPTESEQTESGKEAVTTDHPEDGMQVDQDDSPDQSALPAAPVAQPLPDAPSSAEPTATTSSTDAPTTPSKPKSAIPAALSTPSRAAGATPLKSALRTPNTLSRLGRPATPRSATFSPHLTRHSETYSPAEYDRSTLENTTKDLRSAGKINRDNWIKIIRSVDRFKVKEMQVHPESKANTRVHLPHAVSPGGGSDDGEGDDEDAEEFRLFDGSPLKAKTTVGHVNVMETAAKVIADQGDAGAPAAAVAEAQGENVGGNAEPLPVSATPNTRRVLFPLASANANPEACSPGPKSPLSTTPTKPTAAVVTASTPLKSPGRLIGSVLGSVGSLISRLTPSRKSVEDLIAERQQQG